jgi:cytochrome c553
MRVSWICLVALACGQAANAEAPQPPPPPSARFEHDMIVRFHMHENFDLLRAIEKLLIRGRLEEAKSFARAIAEAPDEPGLGPWAQHAALVRDRAARLASASGIADGCRRAADLAEACASCHASAGVAPEFRSPGRIPPDRPTLEARMTRHLWATDRLWEGIVGAADDSWRDGLDVLAATPLREPQISGERLPLARQLQALARQARMRLRTDTLHDRARSYGEILVICSGCHAVATTTIP